MSKTNNRNDVKSRGEITDTVNRSDTDLEQKVGDLEKVERDVKTIRDTLANLEFAGTAEGADAVKGAVTGAETATVEVFDRQDEQLEHAQSENEGYEREMQENAEVEKSDINKLSDASNQIDTHETVNELVKAKEAALRDIDFLAEQIERAKRAREKSEQAQQEYQRTVHNTGR